MSALNNRYVSIFCFLLLWLLVEYSYACSCTTSRGVEDAISTYDTIFSARVIDKKLERESETYFSSADPVTVSFEVYESWKGTNTQNISLTTMAGGASCGYYFEVGQEYLVYSYNVTSVGLCSRTALLENAAEDLQVLGQGEQPIAGFQLYAGWNMISHIGKYSIEPLEFLADENFEFEGNSVEALWYWDAEEGRWYVYHRDHSIEELQGEDADLRPLLKIDAKKGYWIKMNADALFYHPN